MVGKNELHLNMATMEEAVEHWLNHKVLLISKKQKVTGIAVRQGGSGFIVTIEPTPTNEGTREP